MTDPVDAEVVDATSTELVTAQPPPTLFRTDDPVEIIHRASAVADELKDTVKRAGLIATIKGKEHPQVEAWQTLGAMLGVTAVCTWTRPLLDVPRGWEARVEARTLDGRVIGAAEAQCDRGERMWKDRDDFALRSMAQTRATSKALKGPLGFVMSLAGLESTPAEEMPRDDALRARTVPSAEARMEQEAARLEKEAMEARDNAPERISDDQRGKLVHAYAAFLDAGGHASTVGIKVTGYGLDWHPDRPHSSFQGLTVEQGKELYRWLITETKAKA